MSKHDDEPEGNTMDADMIEKVARAIYVAAGGFNSEWHELKPYAKEVYCVYARAAITAMTATPQAAQVPEAVATITRCDDGDEVTDHRIELDPTFEESLYRYPAGSVFNLYATPAADRALSLVRSAAAELAATQATKATFVPPKNCPSPHALAVLVSHLSGHIVGPSPLTKRQLRRAEGAYYAMQEAAMKESRAMLAARGEHDGR